MASYSNMKHSKIHLHIENDEDGEYAVLELRNLYPLRDVHLDGVELHLTFAFLRELVEKSVEVLPESDGHDTPVVSKEVEALLNEWDSMSAPQRKDAALKISILSSDAIKRIDRLRNWLAESMAASMTR